MQQRISIINKSTGKYRTEEINGREHLITSMLAIEGDSVMNELLYPQSVVNAAMYQLEMLPAPDRHPTVDGKPASAFNPLAINAHNFGGFTQNPEMNGKKGIVELAIDLEVANKTKRGKEIVRKIQNGERIGVSTGLLADVTNKTGKRGGRKYNGIINAIDFDHVAILLDQQPAGENTFTINHDKPKGLTMDRLELDLSPLAVKDRAKLASITTNELLSLVDHEIGVEEAKAVIEKAGLHIHNASKTDVEEYLTNKEAFSAFKKQLDDKRKETISFIVDNSKMSKDDLEGMSQAMLEDLAASVAPKNTYLAPSGERKPNELVLLDEENLTVED